MENRVLVLQRVVSTSSTRPSASNAAPDEVARESVTFPAEAAAVFSRSSGTRADEKSDVRWGWEDCNSWVGLPSAENLQSRGGEKKEKTPPAGRRRLRRGEGGGERKNTNWISLFYSRARRGEAGARRSRSAFRPDAPNSLWGFFTWARWLNVFVSVWSPHPQDFHILLCWSRADCREVGSGRWESSSGDVLMACGLMKSCLSLCCWGSGHPAPFSPLFIPLTPRTLGFNFPWVFTACHCLHSEFRTGMKFGEIISFFSLSSPSSSFNFNFTESERARGNCAAGWEGLSARLDWFPRPGWEGPPGVSSASGAVWRQVAPDGSKLADFLPLPN